MGNMKKQISEGAFKGPRHLEGHEAVRPCEGPGVNERFVFFLARITQECVILGCKISRPHLNQFEEPF